MALRFLIFRVSSFEILALDILTKANASRNNKINRTDLNAVKLREQSLLPPGEGEDEGGGDHTVFFLCLFSSPRPSPAGEGDFSLT